MSNYKFETLQLHVGQETPDHPLYEKYFPNGGASIFTFEIKGGVAEAELLDQGIKPNTIRLSIGTEHIDDILADLQAGFAALKEA